MNRSRTRRIDVFTAPLEDCEVVAANLPVQFLTDDEEWPQFLWLWRHIDDEQV